MLAIHPAGSLLMEASSIYSIARIALLDAEAISTIFEEAPRVAITLLHIAHISDFLTVCIMKSLLS